MPNDIILQASDDAYKAVDIYKAKLKKIGSFRDKFKRFFSNKNDKAKEINEIQIKLKTYGKELQELCLKYYEDKKFRDKARKVMKICKDLFKSFEIKDDITDVGVKGAYGPLIKILIKECISVCDKTMESCKDGGALQFFSSIDSYYYKTIFELRTVKYVDLYVAKKAAKSVVLYKFFKEYHWDRVYESEDRIRDLLVERRRKVEKIRYELGKGKLDWECAYKSLREIKRFLECDKDGVAKKIKEQWERERYFSGASIKKTFDSIGNINLIINKIIVEWPGLNVLDANAKSDVKKAVQETLQPVFGVIEVDEALNLLKKIFEDSFEATKKSIENREKFEKMCNNMILRETQLSGETREVKKDDNDATVYEIANNIKPIREMSRYESCVICYNGEKIVRSGLLGSTKNEVKENMDMIYRTGGHLRDKKSGRRYYLDVPGVIEAE